MAKPDYSKLMGPMSDDGAMHDAPADDEHAAGDEGDYSDAGDELTAEEKMHAKDAGFSDHQAQCLKRFVLAVTDAEESSESPDEEAAEHGSPDTMTDNALPAGA